ncbi:MAG: methylated-DNA--[protein]-cysteine S-methyltransferase [Lysinibacillus sp.]
MGVLYFDKVSCEQGDLYVVASDEGIVYVGTPNAPFAEVEQWATKSFKGYYFEGNHEKTAIYVEQLDAYFSGELKDFDMQIHVKGTPFQVAVWDALKELPYGATTTYSAIAECIGNPKAVRAVGTAIGANPLLAIVPCHRVIGKDGKMTGFRGGIPMKEFLLQLEQR